MLNLCNSRMLIYSRLGTPKGYTARKGNCCTPRRELFQVRFRMKKCSVPDCYKNVIAKGLCTCHYQRFKFKGSVQAERAVGDKTGAWNPKWRGGRTKKQGRVFIYKPEHPYANKSGYVLRYRLVVEKSLGRYLLPSEIVHHKNNISDDDRIENLEVTFQSEHARGHSFERTRLQNGRFL